MPSLEKKAKQLLALKDFYLSDIEKIVGYKWNPWKEECRTDLIALIQTLLYEIKRQIQ